MRSSPIIPECEGFEIVSNYNGPDSFTYKANDGTADSNVATVTINVASVNDEPSFTAGANQTVNEDSGAHSVAWATAISAGPNETQTLNFEVTNDNNALFSNQPAISADGTLSYTPAANAHGTATVSVTLHDDGGTANGGDDTSATQTFTITVNAVNDEPSFTKGANETVLENSGAHSVSGWATAISAGPADESGQALDFIVTNDKNSLFTATGQPKVAANGTLTYTLAPDAIGTATVDVKLHDDGGTANGGVDTSATQSFTIDVNYKFDGFRSPVDNPGTATPPVFNSAKAGQSIPIKFSLFGNQGLSILQPSTTALPNPKVTSVNCTSSAVVDPLEEYASTTANGGLTYDATADQYNYVWKTQSAYANKCFKFELTLTDGTSHVAYFKFLK